MAGRVRLKFNQKAFAEIRTAPKVMAMLDEIAEQTADRAGDGFEARPAAETGGKVRGRAAVITTTHEAMRDQAKSHTLQRSLP